jgi:hypothetical protein
MRRGQVERIVTGATAKVIARAVPVMRVDELLEDSDFLADVLGAARDANGASGPC